MKQNRLAVAGAAAVIVALTAVGSAHAEAPAAAPAKTARITSAAQLHESLQQAVAIEQAQADGLNGLGDGPVGRAV